MGEMLGILLLGAIGWAFWQQRRQAELAWQYMRRYCQHHDLQLLSLARTHRALGHKPLRLLTYYQFEFPATGRAITRASSACRACMSPGSSCRPIASPPSPWGQGRGGWL